MKYIFQFFILISIVGCAASGDRFSGVAAQSEETALVYIYRPSKFFQGGTWPTVFVNNEESFTLKNGGYIYMQLPEGVHTIKIGAASFLSNWAAEDIEFDLRVTQGQQYFYRFDLNFGGVVAAGSFMSISGSVGVTAVERDFAVMEMESLKSSM